MPVQVDALPEPEQPQPEQPEPAPEPEQPEPAPEPEQPEPAPDVAPEIKPAPPEAPTPAVEDSQSSVPDIIAAIDTGQQIAVEQGRSDLGRHLERTRTQLAAQPVPVVVCGEFKRGKSTLVNALLQHAVCPVDADVVTAVPTTVQFSERPYVAALTRSEEGEVLRREEYALDALAALVTESADPAQPTQQRAVEVGMSHRMLRSGLCLVDTPGVGGLDSAHGFLTLGALRQARGLLFVTDAAQELTAPELGFLRTAVERCPRAALVITKVDLYPQWRRIVELDRGHLERAGLSLPVIAVSSFLRLRAIRRPELNAESGFTELVTFLAKDVVASSRADAARTAAHEVEFVASQLQQKAEVERVVLESPEEREKVVAELDQVRRRATKLASPTATWQQTLGDGIQDLVSDVEHDLQRRFRTVLHDAEEVIDQSDPLQTWADTEVWLRRQVAMVSMQNRDLLTERALQLAESVAEQFDLQAGAGVELRLADVDDAIDSITLASKASLVMPGGKLAPLMVAARTSFYVPLVLGGFAASFIPGFGIAIAGVSVGLGAGIARKIIKDERTRQRTFRQQQAKAAVRKFVDEVAFAMNKQTRDGLRATQRQLRDDFQARAMLMQRSAAESLEAARQASRLGPAEQQRRRQQLQDQDHQLGRVRATARELAGAG